MELFRASAMLQGVSEVAHTMLEAVRVVLMLQLLPPAQTGAVAVAEEATEAAAAAASGPLRPSPRTHRTVAVAVAQEAITVLSQEPRPFRPAHRVPPQVFRPMAPSRSRRSLSTRSRPLSQVRGLPRSLLQQRVRFCKVCPAPHPPPPPTVLLCQCQQRSAPRLRAAHP